ncbi:MAG: hypothetical protein V4496_07895 [Pseudomonadota bacterium]
MQINRAILFICPDYREIETIIEAAKIIAYSENIYILSDSSVVRAALFNMKEKYNIFFINADELFSERLTGKQAKYLTETQLQCLQSYFQQMGEEYVVIAELFDLNDARLQKCVEAWLIINSVNSVAPYNFWLNLRLFMCKPVGLFIVCGKNILKDLRIKALLESMIMLLEKQGYDGDKFRQALDDYLQCADRKKLADTLRFLCHGKSPMMEACSWQLNDLVNQIYRWIDRIRDIHCLHKGF